MPYVLGIHVGGTTTSAAVARREGGRWGAVMPLPLGTHSETFNSYGGGPGTVALHGWPDPAVFGRADSDGCVRVPTDALHLLSTLPLGTLVVLR